MKLETLDDLLIEQLNDLYSAEQQLVEALPEVEECAQDPELKRAIHEHHEQTRGHVSRLERGFEYLGVKPGGVTCDAMKGLLKEGRGLLKANGSANVRDAALIANAQRVEHYEIAGYGTARAFAQQLGYTELADELQLTLDEEMETDQRLTEIAEGSVNQSAANGSIGKNGPGQADE